MQKHQDVLTRNHLRPVLNILHLLSQGDSQAPDLSVKSAIPNNTDSCNKKLAKISTDTTYTTLLPFHTSFHMQVAKMLKSVVCNPIFSSVCIFKQILVCWYYQSLTNSVYVMQILQMTFMGKSEATFKLDSLHS